MKPPVLLLMLALARGWPLNAGAAAGDQVFIPSNPPEMKPLAGRNSPAHVAARQFRRGINLGDYLEVPPGARWGATCAAVDFAQMRAEGFDHVRVPVGWHHYTGPGPAFTLAPEIFAKVDFVATNALANHLAVIVNIHHFNELTSDPAGQTEKFLALWQQVAAHCASFPETLAFELLNEPKDAATTAVMNPLYAQAIAAIRQTNPHRMIFVEPGKWGSIDELKNLVLPAGDDKLIVSVHCYEPFHFTHQGARWAGPDVTVTGIQFPGPPAQPLVPDAALDLKPWVRDWIERYNTLPSEKNPSGPTAFTGKLALARAWSDFYGRPVHVGEFGCYTKAEPDSRSRFLMAFRQALDAQDLGWAMWDWNSNFRYWDKNNARPMPGLRRALFGP